MSDNRAKVALGLVLGVLALTFCFPYLSYGAPPEVVRLDLGATVGTNYTIVAPNAGWGATGTTALFVLPGAATGTSTSAAPSVTAATNVTYLSGPSPMFGSAGGYGMLLLSFTSADLATMTTNLPTNANPTMLGGTTGPVNKSRISLNTAGLVTGTSLTVTLNMRGNIPQLVAVMGGSYPTVTYDSSLFGGDGQLVIVTQTTDTTSNAGDAFTSLLGFMVMADTALGTTPIRVVTQTDAWVGDLYPLFPGFDGSAAGGSGAAGTQGTLTAKCGTTIYGQTGLQRNINTFIPNASLPIMFAAATTASDVRAFTGTSPQDSSVLTTGVTNFGVQGVRASFTYTFASPKDTSFGIPGTSSTSASGSSTGVCFLSAVRRAAASGPLLASTLGFLAAVGGALFLRRRARG